MFGDGFFGKLYEIAPHPTDESLLRCKIYPVESTREQFSLQTTDPQRDRITGAYQLDYPKDQIIMRYKGKAGRSWLFLCNWKGEKTDLIESFNLKHLSTVEYLRGQVENLLIQRAQTRKEIREAHNQPQLYSQQQFEKITKFLSQKDEKAEGQQGADTYG